MKENLQNVMKKCKRGTPPAGIEDMNSRKLRDQEGLPPSGMKTFSLVTVMLAEILDTKQFIANPMQEMTI